MHSRPENNESPNSNSKINKRLEKPQAAEQNNNELNAVLARRRELNKEIPEQLKPDEVQGKVTKNHFAAQEFQNTSVSSLKKQLTNKILPGQAGIQTQTAQKESVQADITQLRKTSSILEKTKVIEHLMSGTKSAIQAVKANEVSTQAKTELKLKPELNMFQEEQEKMLVYLQEKLNSDFSEYSTILKTISVGKDKFFELSFIYRSYQVCLEQDMIRHAAEKATANSGNKPSAPTKLAIQSLNYYEDFFRNLTDIEKIWPQAGAVIRKSEMAVLYLTMTYKNTGVIDGIIDKNETALKKFYQDLDICIQKNRVIALYIQSGNGLDTKQHPWTLNKCNRIAQANSSIKFNEIVAVDEVHQNILNDVDKRVENDTATRMVLK